MAKVALISFLTNSINTRLLSAYLKKNGHEAICVFCEGLLSDKGLDALAGILTDNRVSLVGISLVTDNYQSAVTVTKAVKEKVGVPVIWGGAHVNVRPEECLRHADMICMGEGEEALLELVRNISSGGSPDTRIRNIWFNSDGGVVRNEMRDLVEDLDKYPFPDFNLATQYVMNVRGFEVLNGSYLKKEYSIITSRGCPYSCTYCYNNYRRKNYSGKGRFLRARSIENVIAELEEAKRLFPDIRKLNFWDDSFIARSAADIEKFGALYAKRIALPFFALVEPMTFDYAKMKTLIGCGLKGLQIGIQSGSERTNRDVYNRPVRNSKVLEMADFLNKASIDVIYDIIFNNPYETREDLLETIELLLKFPRPFTFQGYNLIFYPGTEITDKALADGYISRKGEADDFSTIQGRMNSPVAMAGKAEVSGRFYTINYDAGKNDYLNSIFSLITCLRIPRNIVRFFARRENLLNSVMVKAIVGGYNLLAAVKRTSHTKE